MLFAAVPPKETLQKEGFTFYLGVFCHVTINSVFGHYRV